MPSGKCSQTDGWLHFSGKDSQPCRHFPSLLRGSAKTSSTSHTAHHQINIMSGKTSQRPLPQWRTKGKTWPYHINRSRPAKINATSNVFVNWRACRCWEDTQVNESWTVVWSTRIAAITLQCTDVKSGCIVSGGSHMQKSTQHKQHVTTHQRWAAQAAQVGKPKGAEPAKTSNQSCLQYWPDGKKPDCIQSAGTFQTTSKPTAYSWEADCQYSIDLLIHKPYCLYFWSSLLAKLLRGCALDTNPNI